jgi:hypothetical protein
MATAVAARKEEKCIMNLRRGEMGRKFPPTRKESK